MTLVMRGLVGSSVIVFILGCRKLIFNYLPKRVFVWLWCLISLRLLIPFNLGSPFNLFSLINRFAKHPDSSGEINQFRSIVSGAGWPSQISYFEGINLFMILWILGGLILGGKVIGTHLRERKQYLMGIPVQEKRY